MEIFPEWLVINADSLHELSKLMNKHEVVMVAHVEYIFGSYSALVRGFK